MKLFNKKENSNKNSIFPENSIFGHDRFFCEEKNNNIEIKLDFLNYMVPTLLYGAQDDNNFLSDVFFKYDIIIKKDFFFFFKIKIGYIKNHIVTKTLNSDPSPHGPLYLYISKKDFVKYKLLSS